ncbi:MAG: EFR1 family ferrodoxin [Dehalococcoidales bacterium]|nr:MAG: EFR1 family ferrodoxin [Dehalococcoidales bacterium]
MKRIIYYFSGTGNTLFVARDIAQGLEASLIPIVSLADDTVVTVDSDVTGIVYPVYYGELPVIVREFAEKLSKLEGKYIFAVCTFGGSAGDSLRNLRKIILLRGGKLSSTYGVHMPQNAFYKFWEKHEPLYRNWRQKKLKVVISNTEARKSGNFFTNILFDIIFKGIQSYVKPKYKQSFIKLSGASPDLSVEELIRLNDTSFSSTDDCTGCGICAKVCPVNNIIMFGGRPVWQHRCENCISCYNFCPEKAIRNGIASEGYLYRHPDITVKDMMIRYER